MEPNDLVLWIESRQALVAGDTLIDRGRGLRVPLRLGEQGRPAGRRSSRRCARCSELPVELVLPTHGAPTDRAALERTLS